MKTRTVGELLRSERLKHRLSLEETAKRSRIRVAYLEALEENNFQQLPAAIFVKGYIKAYSRLFGFDEQPLLALLRRDFKESAKGTLVPREFIKPVLKNTRFWTPVTAMVVVGGVAFLTIFSYVGIQWYNFNQPPTLEITEPAVNAFVSAQVVVQGRTKPEAMVTVNDQPVAVKADGSFQTEVYIPREGLSAISVETRDRRGKVRSEERSVYVRF